MPLLNPGDPFPRLRISTTDGQTLTLPDAFAGDFGVVLFYRGSWCHYCNAQLRAFERSRQALADAGIRVAALSVDDEKTTTALVARHKLTFPVGYDAGSARHRRPHRRLRQPGPRVPAVDRLRARPLG
jgi:peroxiredoxin